MQLLMSPLDMKVISFHAIRCNGCLSENYPGTRYECSQCKDFRLCQRCYDQCRFSPSATDEIHHNSSHEMASIAPPENPNNEKVKWIALTIKAQNNFGSQLSTRDFDEHNTEDKDENTKLARKIGYALFGVPIFDPEECENSYWGYTEEQETRIKKLRHHVYTLHKKAFKMSEIVSINFVFVSLKGKDFICMIPLIRLLCDKPNGCYFIEPDGRTYESWDDFLKNNRLPACIMCYPENGWYSTDENGNSRLAFKISQEFDASRELIKATDIISTAAGVAATVLICVSFFTPLGPIVALGVAATVSATGAYGSARSVYQLYDRTKHKQTINPLEDKESFFCWLTLFGSLFAIGSTAGIRYISNAGFAGRHVGQFSRATVTAAIVGDISTNAIALVAEFCDLYTRFNNGKEITAFEIFQFGATLLFFTNSVLNVQKASTIIKNAQKAKLLQVRNKLSNDVQILNFDFTVKTDQQKALKIGNAKTGTMHGAEITIGNLDKAMKNANWQEIFGHGDIGKSAERHAEQPTHFANGAGIITEEAAIQKALTNKDARKQQNKESMSTVFALPPHELDAKLKAVAESQNLTKGQGNLSLPGSYYGFEIKLGRDGKVIYSKKILYENPTFKWDCELSKAVHFFGESSKVTVLKDFPPHVPIFVDYEHHTIYEFRFTQFIQISKDDKDYEKMFERNAD